MLSVSLNLLVAQAGCILELSSKSNLLSALTPASGMGWGFGAAAPGSVGSGLGPLAWGGQTVFPPGVGPAGLGGWPQTGVGVGAGAAARADLSADAGVGAASLLELAVFGWAAGFRRLNLKPPSAS